MLKFKTRKWVKEVHSLNPTICIVKPKSKVTHVSKKHHHIATKYGMPNLSVKIVSCNKIRKLALTSWKLKGFMKLWKFSQVSKDITTTRIMTRESPYYLFSLFQDPIASFYGKFTKVNFFCQNILTTIGRLRRLDLRNFKVEKHFSSSILPKTRLLPISTSMKYSNGLWHNILELDIVCHKWIKRLRSKRSCIITTIWFFIVILKKSCWMSSVEVDNMLMCSKAC